VPFGALSASVGGSIDAAIFHKGMVFGGTRGQEGNAIAVLGASYALDFRKLGIETVFLGS